MVSFIPQEGGLSNLFPFRNFISVISVVVVAGVGFLVNSPGCKTSVIGPDRLLSDTTSHNFVWRIDTLGDGNASELHDALIFSRDNIWVVGELYSKDSTGSFVYPPYNCAMWDGLKWKLDRVSVNYLGNEITPPLRRAFAFSSSDIWVTTEGFPMHWDGSSWQLYQLQDMGFNVSVTEIWGTSSSDIYFGGLNGSLIHYDGTSWVPINSGVSEDIEDIFGNSGEILALASNAPLYPPSRTLLKIAEDHSVTVVPDSGLALTVQSLFFVSNNEYLVVGSGLFKVSKLGQIWKDEASFVSNYLSRIRGKGTNDIAVVGSFGFVGHYNGSSWATFPSLPSFPSSYLGVEFASNTIVAVGVLENGRAIVSVGNR